MLYDDLLFQLKSHETDISLINQFWTQSNSESEIARLRAASEDVEFWKNPNQSETLKKLQKLRHEQELLSHILKSQAELEEMVHLFQDDAAELEKIAIEIKRLRKEILGFKVIALLSDAQDNSDCFLSINSGAGGTESQDWADMLLRMYVRYGEKQNFSVQMVDYQGGEEAGIKSATLYIKGKNAYGLLKSEHGIHRLVRISPFDSNKRRHTSFAGVMVMPEVEDIKAIEIDPKDLRIDTYRSSGAGGQHVNKTESAVRITHLPTNTVVQCQIERSQIQNRATAMKMLNAKLLQHKRAEQEAKLNAGVEKKKIEWGSQIRSYVLHPYKMVKDHRTDCESPQPELVLDGDLDDFIEQYLLWSKQ